MPESTAICGLHLARACGGDQCRFAIRPIMAFWQELEAARLAGADRMQGHALPTVHAARLTQRHVAVLHMLMSGEMQGRGGGSGC